MPNDVSTLPVRMKRKNTVPVVPSAIPGTARWARCVPPTISRTWLLPLSGSATTRAAVEADQPSWPFRAVRW